MKTLFTTFIGYKSNIAKVKFYTELPQSTISLIENRVVKLSLRSTPSERSAAFYLRSLGIIFEEQIMFMIDGNMYFADFFLPKLNIILEVDGGIHKSQLSYDFARDKRFKSVGIKVLRIKNELVSKANIEKMLSKNISMGYKTKIKKSVKKSRKPLTEAEKIKKYQKNRKGNERIPEHWLYQGR